MVGFMVLAQNLSVSFLPFSELGWKDGAVFIR
jgi:hypothetical protein